MLKQSDILAQIQRERTEAIDDGWTTAEFCAATGYKRTAAKDRINRGISSGEIVRAQDKPKLNMCGVCVMVPAYRYISGKP